jgi:capsular polysaccharide export protein
MLNAPKLVNSFEEGYEQDITGSDCRNSRSDLGGHSESSLHLSSLPVYKNVLLLQGPVGPFFLKLAQFLEQRGTTAHKINFNAGDEWFYPDKKLNTSLYTHTLEYWPNYLEEYIVQHQIEAVFLFGDCRPIHLPAKLLCRDYKIDLWVFEEGYFRPNFFTLDFFGVNAHSRLNKIPLESLLITENSNANPLMAEFKSLNSYNQTQLYMARHAFLYWLMNIMQPIKSKHYDHHRELNLALAYRWTKNIFFYFLYLLKERSAQKKLITKGFLDKKSFFLFPLQVHDDAQMKYHSNFESVEDAIQFVITSFHKHILIHASTALPILIIKHHPMDRGHTNYSRYISNLCKTLGLEDYVYYLHNLDVGSITPYLKGCITVNSTLGLRMLCEGVPVKNLGASFYDKAGITCQKSLDEFWHSPGSVSFDKVQQFKQAIISQTQVNGCLYSPGYRLN